MDAFSLYFFIFRLLLVTLTLRVRKFCIVLNFILKKMIHFSRKISLLLERTEFQHHLLFILFFQKTYWMSNIWRIKLCRSDFPVAQTDRFNLFGQTYLLVYLIYCQIILPRWIHIYSVKLCCLLGVLIGFRLNRSAIALQHVGYIYSFFSFFLSEDTNYLLTCIDVAFLKMLKVWNKTRFFRFFLRE